MMSMPNTIFRPVPDYVDLYAGMDGSIVHGGRGGALKPRVDANGYLRVYVPKVGKKKVHQLVAAAFLGPRPEGIETRHVDGNKTNNHLSNLCYGSRKDNAQDCIRHGSLPNTNKTECPQGHRYTPENTYIDPVGGGRQCRECRTERVKESQERFRQRIQLRGRRLTDEQKDAIVAADPASTNQAVAEVVGASISTVRRYRMGL